MTAKQREQVEFYRARINYVLIRIIHNNVSFDWSYSTIADYIGYKPIKLDIPDKSISLELENALGETMEANLGPILGWPPRPRRSGAQSGGKSAP